MRKHSVKQPQTYQDNKENRPPEIKKPEHTLWFSSRN